MGRPTHAAAAPLATPGGLADRFPRDRKIQPGHPAFREHPEMSATTPAGRVVGLVPSLPWPLSTWRWWSEPVNAERLAALRTAVAGFLFLAILRTALPTGDTFLS